jgi:hypothetical protein
MSFSHTYNLETIKLKLGSGNEPHSPKILYIGKQKGK